MSWIEANGVALRYQFRDGVGDGPLVVLLHEMGGCLDSWDGVIAALPAHYACLAYDARGAGLSEKPAQQPTVETLATDLAALLDALAIRRPVVLAGCAVGAAVAIRFAADQGARASHLVLLAPATGIAPERRAALLDLADAVERDGMRARIALRFDHSYAERYFVGRSDREAVRARLLQNDPRSYAATYRMLCAMDLGDALGRITAPTLVVAGAHDGTRPPALVEPIARAITDARFVTIDSGHAMPILTPGLVASLIHRHVAG
jgi:3-oxoadipate enol-lactonase